MKFKKKPIVIDAEQFLEGQPLPVGVCTGERCSSNYSNNTYVAPHVHTAHQNQRVNLQFGDWVVPEPDGEHYYPIKPDIFANTYDPVKETESRTAYGLLVPR
jgi:hypothetical protein